VAEVGDARQFLLTVSYEVLSCLNSKLSHIKRAKNEKPYLSIVVPVYNEADNLEMLYSRLTSTLDDYGKAFEIILVNDGSRDATESILNDLHKRRPNHIRIVHFNGNFGSAYGDYGWL